MKYAKIIFLMFLLLVAVCPVYALTKTVTITAAEFNAAYTTISYYYPRSKLGLQVNVSRWTAVITHDLVFSNTSSAVFAGICIHNENITTTQVPVSEPSIRVHFYGNNKVKVLYTNGTHIVTLLDFSNYVLPITITYYENRAFTVQDDGAINRVGQLNADLAPRYILYVTRGATNLLSSGAMTITIQYPDPTINNMTDIVVQLLPAIIIIACLGIAMSMMKSAMKQ